MPVMIMSEVTSVEEYTITPMKDVRDMGTESPAIVAISPPAKHVTLDHQRSVLAPGLAGPYEMQGTYSSGTITKTSHSGRLLRHQARIAKQVAAGTRDRTKVAGKSRGTA